MTSLGFHGGRVLTAAGWQDGAVLALDDRGRIAAITQDTGAAQEIDLAGGALVPGYIDVQVNGGGGVLFNDDPTPSGIATIAAAHARYGCTAILPTLISALPDVIARGLDAVEQAIADGVPGCIGIHVEGPVLNLARKGIHNPDHLRQLDDGIVDLLIRPRPEMGDGRILFTIAPEYLHADQARALLDAGIVLSAGHTNADYATATAAFAMGVTGVTHLFNAMSALHHREPGMVGATLADRQVYAGLIVDGFHFHPALLPLVLRARPFDRNILVSDAMPCVGSGQTEFMLDGRTIHVADGRCVDDAGTLAGAALDMGAAVRNTMAMGGVPLADAVRMASGNPAAFLRLDHQRGAIAPGLRADLVQLDAANVPVATWIGGRQVA